MQGVKKQDKYGFAITTPVTTRYVAGVGGIVTIQPREGRLSMLIGSAAGTTFNVGFKGLASGVLGIQEAAAQQPLYLHRLFMGSALDEGCDIVAAAQNDVIVVVEFIMSP